MGRVRNRIAACTRILDKLLFPPVCPFCGEVLGFLPYCQHCADESEKLRIENNGLLCKNHYKADYLKDVYAVYQYQSIVRNSIHRFKFQGQLYLVRYYAEEMAGLLHNNQYDCILAVPASRREIRRHKGCHGALLLAEQLCRQTQLPLYKKVLIKSYDTEPQHDLNAIRRAGNLTGSMKVQKPELILGKDILLVDDLTTTGNTLNYCAKLCMAFGAKSVTGICYAAVLYQSGEQKEKMGEEK